MKRQVHVDFIGHKWCVLISNAPVITLVFQICIDYIVNNVYLYVHASRNTYSRFGRTFWSFIFGRKVIKVATYIVHICSQNAVWKYTKLSMSKKAELGNVWMTKLRNVSDIFDVVSSILYTIVTLSVLHPIRAARRHKRHRSLLERLPHGLDIY